MRIIMYTNKETGAIETFSTLSSFYKKYPEFKEKKENINKSLSRKKQPFEKEKYKIERVIVTKK